MIELKRDTLVFSFPEVHPDARLQVEFQRTLRIPDDDRSYPLPPGLGPFPLRHVDDFGDRLPDSWVMHGGVMLPMFQSEALWINFTSPSRYPFAVKVATGKINAVTGETWREGLHRGDQDYLVAPPQPWLDGYCVEKGMIRQFVAMPLGSGYSVEEQLKRQAEHGGIQLLVHPLKAKVWERIVAERRSQCADVVRADVGTLHSFASMEMGLAPGGRMRQEVYDDPFQFSDWDRTHRGRCFVHLANSLVWRAVTGEAPPTVPPTAEEYTRAELPWFDYYAEGAGVVRGSEVLRRTKTVTEMGKKKGDVPLPENIGVEPGLVVPLGRGERRGQVREGAF